MFSKNVTLDICKTADKLYLKFNRLKKKKEKLEQELCNLTLSVNNNTSPTSVSSPELYLPPKIAKNSSPTSISATHTFFSSINENNNNNYGTTNQHYSIDQNQSYLEFISIISFAISVSSTSTNENNQEPVHVEEIEVNNDDSTSNFENNISNDDNEDMHIDDDLNDEINTSYYTNCHRNNLIKELYLHQVERTEVNRKRKFRFFNNRNTRQHYLHFCDECFHYFTEGSETSKYKFMWPSFIWSMLTNEKLRQSYGTKIWQLLPNTLREWWFYSIVEDPFFIENEITLLEPSSIFKDNTQDTNEFNLNIKSHKLGDITSTINKHLIPKVLCPWGYSEYIHKCGSHVCTC